MLKSKNLKITLIQLVKSLVSNGGKIMAKKMISLEISEELKEALRVEAFKRSLSISALIRQVLEENIVVHKDEEPAGT